MKKIQFLILVVLVAALSLNLGNAQCGNSTPGGGGGEGYPSEPSTDESDPIVPYTGNEFKKIYDLQVWGGVGELPLEWNRHANSRAVAGSQLFGMGHYWRHEYQWDFYVTANDSSGRARRGVITPEGATWVFTQIDPNTWVGPVGCELKLVPSGNDFTLLTKNSFRYFFKQSISGTNISYLMTEFYDAQSNKYTLTYNTANQVTSVVEPAGRSLKVTYITKSANKVDFTDLGKLAAVPATGAWTEIPVTNTTAYRYVRLLTADGAYGNIADVEFYDDLGNKLSGTIISSDSAEVARGAFDGNSATKFLSSSQSGAYIGYDLGTAKKISKMRFLAAAGKEAFMYPIAWGYTPVKVQGANQAPVTITVISKVETNDGRAVNYTYANFNDASLPYVFPTLTEAVYGDGTKGTYGYGQIFSGQRPLVTDWKDVRYGKLPMARSKTVYQNSRASVVLGMVDKQVNPETGEAIATVGAYNGNLHEPIITFSNGQVIHQQMYEPSHPANTGMMWARIDGNGNKTSFAYDSNGFLITKTDALGRVTSYTRSALGNILTLTHPDGSIETWTRNSLDSTIAYKDFLGRTTSYTRDSLNRIIRVDYADASYETFTYNAFSEVLQKRQRNGGMETFTYDARGLLTLRSNALGNVTKFGYDIADRLAKETDAKNNITTILYNERGLVTQVTHADGSFKSYTYNPIGDVLTETNELGNTAQYSYDLFRRLMSITDSLNRVKTVKYSVNSYEAKPLQIIFPSGKTTNFSYDKEWNLLTKTAGVGTSDEATATFTYDKVYNILTQKDPRGKTISMVYDVRNRKITENDPLGNVEAWTYDAAGNILTYKDALNRVTTHSYDSMDDLISVVDAKNQTTHYFYDLAGNMTKIVDAKGNSYQNTFDLLDRKTAMIYPDNSREQYAYDSVSNISAYTTRMGQVRTSVYDNRNREISFSWSDSTPGVTRTFDVLGRLLTSGNGVSTISRTYDAVNELLTEKTMVGGNVRVLTSTYNVDGNRMSLTYSGGTVVSYDYTNRNQIAAIYEDGGAPLATYSYDLKGNRTNKILENGTSTAYVWDDASRLTSITERKGGATLLATAYSLNAVDSRTSKVQGGLNESYSFDAIDQLVGVNYTGKRNVLYNYDATGNRTTVVDKSVTSNYSTNNLNQYTSVAGASISYDGNGNLTNGSTIQNGLFFYDAQNRLTKSVVGLNTIDFAYDSQNRVVKRTLNGVSTFLIYDGWDLIEERNAAGAIQARYVHGSQTDEILARTTTSGTVYYHQDGIGSTTALTDGAGNIVEKYSYDVFGKATITDPSSQTQPTSLVDNRFMFTGREYLKEIGLYDYRNRVYSQELGRFLQTDPIRFSAGDVNIYRYCDNSVINFLDPFGLADVVTDVDAGTTTFTDDDGNKTVYPSSGKVTPRSKPGAEDPYKSDDVNVSPPKKNKKAYGPGDLITTDDPRGRWIHGGGSGLKDPLAPQQGWYWTQGCTRMQNDDLAKLVDQIKKYKKDHPGKKIPYERKGTGKRGGDPRTR
ncbi:MAG: RHS repeat-associated core domain-containing protein [Verrucomicrobiota bacterium]